jgi:clan AA aspartic protease (TIGR02281 family)
MKQIALMTILFVLSFNLNGQFLTVQETINYINKSYKNDNQYDWIELSNDGTLKIHKSIYEERIMHISDVTVTNYNGTENNFKIRCYDLEPQKTDWGNIYRGVNNCILTLDNGYNRGTYFQEFIKLNLPYETQKLCNAYKYLFSVAKESGNYIRRDDDPFSPENYNPNSIHIQGNTPSSRISLEIENGVYYINISIGTIKKRFVLDSGASEVSLSENFANELIREGIIKQEYFTTPSLYKLANGNIISCERLILPEIVIGNYTISNVRAVIVKGSSPLLLGKSLLDKFSRWTIENSTKTLILEK